jgi:acetoin utilization deacetylase AcuC-like enzyme
VDAIERLCADGGGMIDLDTIAAPGSFEAALHAAGGAVRATEMLLAGEDRSAFCALRPPGHHAEPAQAMGFCLFNNIAVAARHAISACGVERALILDWDVHHGNGTEAAFAGDADVLFTSIHQWPLYPGTGPAEYEGEGPGEGHTLNLTVPPGAGADEFLALVQHVVVPVARSFEPGLIAISAGFDAHRNDPLASCRVETETFGEMAASMRELAAELDVPILVCLEGGYSPAALASSVVATMAGLEGSAPPRVAPRAAAEPHVSRLGRRWALAAP